MSPYQGGGAHRPPKLWTFYTCTYSTRNNQIWHGDQTRCEENFTRSTTNADARSVAAAHLLVTIKLASFYYSVSTLITRQKLTNWVTSNKYQKSKQKTRYVASGGFFLTRGADNQTHRMGHNKWAMQSLVSFYA